MHNRAARRWVVLCWGAICAGACLAPKYDKLSASPNAVGGVSGEARSQAGSRAHGGDQGGAPAPGGGGTQPGGQGGSSATGSGGTAGAGGLVSSAGLPPQGGSSPTGGIHSSGAFATGATGGRGNGGTSTGGLAPTGGIAPTGGVATGGTSTAGAAPTGGAETGGTETGGAETGGAETGGAEIGGGGGPGGGGTEIDCGAPMPSGGTDHCGANTQGTAGDLSWSLWSNATNSQSCITTYDTTAFGASWNQSGDYLACLGLELASNARPYTDYGIIKADYSFTRTGSGGGYSYIGMYGWSDNPCVEWYIVDDRFDSMPFVPWAATQTGSATIDGETYQFFRNQTSGTGGSRCSGVNTWDQFWSVRQSARHCGTIPATKHFAAWADEGMTLGNLLEVKILVQVGGGQGSIDFPVANVVAE